jgi:hypothetical protein
MPEIPPDIPLDAVPPTRQPEAIMLVGSMSIGLIPGEVSSVAPNGMPVGPTDVPGCEPVEMPSGEVAAIPGAGTPIPPTWAKAVLQPSIAIAAVIHRRLILALHVRARRIRPRADLAAP